MRFFLLVATFASLFVPACGNKNVSSPLYLLKVRIDPSSGEIESEVRIQNPPDSCFYLNQNLKIHRIISDGRIVSFHREPASKPLPYTVGTAVVVETKVHE